MAWRSELFYIDILICTSQIMHMKVELRSKGMRFNLTFVYGFNKEAEWRDLWKALTQLMPPRHH